MGPTITTDQSFARSKEGMGLLRAIGLNTPSDTNATEKPPLNTESTQPTNEEWILMPRLLHELKGKHKVVKVGCSEGWSIAITDEGKAFTWGTHYMYGLGSNFGDSVSSVPTRIKSIKVHSFFSSFFTQDTE